LTKKLKRWILTGGMASVVLFLSGCMRIDQETGEPQGFMSDIIYNFLVIPTEMLLDWLASAIGGYGLAIIALTILVRLILLPLTFRQRRSMTESQYKMAAVQPALTEIQNEMKETNDPQRQQDLQKEQMQIMQENDINVLGQLAGCLPLLIQMPIFIAVLTVLRNSESIANASFLGVQLGETSIILGLLTGVIYFFQSKLMQKSMPEAQQKQTGAMMYMTPILMLFISVTGPAGLALYWFAGGIFAIAEALFMNNYFKPKIEKELEEKYGDQKKVERKPQPEKKAPESTVDRDKIREKNVNANPKNRNRNQNGNGTGRNSGKQNRN